MDRRAYRLNNTHSVAMVSLHSSEGGRGDSEVNYASERSRKSQALYRPSVHLRPDRCRSRSGQHATSAHREWSPLAADKFDCPSHPPFDLVRPFLHRHSVRCSLFGSSELSSASRCSSAMVLMSIYQLATVAMVVPGDGTGEELKVFEATLFGYVSVLSHLALAPPLAAERDQSGTSNWACSALWQVPASCTVARTIQCRN